MFRVRRKIQTTPWYVRAARNFALLNARRSCWKVLVWVRIGTCSLASMVWFSITCSVFYVPMFFNHALFFFVRGIGPGAAILPRMRQGVCETWNAGFGSPVQNV